MVNRNKNVCRWCLREGAIIIFVLLLMMGLLEACGDHPRSHLQQQHIEHHLKYWSKADIQQFESIIVGRQKQHRAQLSLLRNQANELLKRFHQEVTHWGNRHLYYDPYNGARYQLDYEYDQEQGFGSNADDVVSAAHTANDYQAAVQLITTNITHLKAMESDEADKTQWFQAHASDLELIRYHHLSGLVVVVSFVGQVCRIYRDGKLIKAFLVTSGRFTDPSPAGLWHIFRRRSPTIFKSHVPIGSPSWYPDTPISYAMEYQEGGYYLHDSWWRAYYGPGTNFPHYDPDGEQFAGSGSHGCINLPPDAAAWMYVNTDYGTAVITY